METNSTKKYSSHKRRTNFAWAVLSAVFFLPLGIVSFIYSRQADNLYDEERPMDARMAAATSRMWSIISFIVGTLTYTFLAIYCHVSGIFQIFWLQR